MAAAPQGLLSVNSQAAAPLVSGAGHYAVVSKHATWGIFETMSQAHREAELIRHSGAIPTTAVRCTPDMVKQYQLGKLGNFVEIDGWAITPGEAKTKGFDLLRRAGDRNNARRQLLEHCIAETRVWLEQHEDARKDGFWYVHDGEGEVLAVFDEELPANNGAQLSRCSTRLFDALTGHLNDGMAKPEISIRTGFHMLEEEHGERIAADIIYRLALDGEVGRFDPACIVGPVNARYVAVARESHWVLGAGMTTEEALGMAATVRAYMNEELVAVRSSQALARAVLINGYEVPGFWTIVEDTAVHESELGSL